MVGSKLHVIGNFVRYRAIYLNPYRPGDIDLVKLAHAKCVENVTALISNTAMIKEEAMRPICYFRLW